MKKLIKYAICVCFVVVFALLLLYSPLYSQELPDITGGVNVKQGEHPWIVAINNLGYKSVGTLIDNEWILTCAHCIEKYPNYMPVVTIGGVDKTIPEEGEITLIALEKHIHPDYDPLTGENDFGLVRIMPITETDFIKILQPYTGTMQINGPLLITGTIVGYGKSGMYTDDYDTLKSAEVQFICQILSLSLVKCADPYNPDRGVCVGDSGGLVKVETELGPRAYGVVWGGNQCDEEKRFTSLNTIQQHIETWAKPIMNRPRHYSFVPWLKASG